MNQSLTITNTLVFELLGRGVQSDLANKIAERIPDLRTLAATKAVILRQNFNESEVDAIVRALKRKEISPATIFKLVQECDWKCCLCWSIDKESPIIIHHIEEHSKTLDDSYDNLVLLCPDHHAKAHSKWDISRSPCPPDLIRLRKRQWIQAIAEFKAGLRKGPGREEYWLADVRPTAPLSSEQFFGRKEDLEELEHITLDSRPHKIALVGMGGVGKTTLALKLAEKCAAHFSGGVFWADLSSENGDILPILRFWLESCAGPGNYPNDRNGASSALRSLILKHVSIKGNALFVIDDARESWSTTVGQLLEIIPASGTVILTTRDATVSAGFGFPIKSVIPLNAHASLELLRCSAKSPLLDSGPAVTATLIALLGGLPLALALVGKHIALNSSKPGYSLEMICRRIESFSDSVLSFPGHRGLAASFALSYESLDSDEKRAFRWLGIFAPGLLRVKSVSTTMKTDAADTERWLDRMVAGSILNWGAEPGVYRIHPLLHQYASFMLGGSTRSLEFIEASRSHLCYYAELVDLVSKSNPYYHEELQAEFSNVLLAIDNADDNTDWRLVSNFMSALWSATEFLPRRGYEQVAVRLLQRAISVCKQNGDLGMEAAHLGNLGAAKNRLGLLSDAKECYERACLIAKQAGVDDDVPAFLQNLGVVLTDMGETSDALEVLRKALEKAESQSNLPVALNVLGSLGSIYLRCGDFQRANHFYGAGLKLCRMAGDRLGEGNNLSNIGLILLETGEPEEGERCIKQALDIARNIGDKHGQANRLGHLGGIWLNRCMNAENVVDHIIALGQAREFTLEALRITREVGDRVHEGCWLGNLGNCFSVSGDKSKAAQHLQEAIEIARETGHKEGEGQCLLNLGVIERDRGNPDAAFAKISEAVAIFRSIKSRHLAAANRALEALPNQSED